jgi:hypothetical protein
MSAQQLADECAKIGYSIPRSVLTNLENGYRDTISTTEVDVLAAALGVPSLLLEYPVGHVEVVEVLPGVEVSPWDALRWAMGDRELPGIERWSGHIEVIRTFQLHQYEVDRAQEARAAALQAERLLEADFAPERPLDRMEAGHAVQAPVRRADFALWLLRGHIRRAGLIPPQLPPELAHIDGPNFHPPQLSDPASGVVG